MEIDNSTPCIDHFKMTAEFNRQQASYMIWPQRQDNWRNGGKPAQKAFTQLAKIISKFQPLTMLVNEDQYLNAKAKLKGIARVVEMSSMMLGLKMFYQFISTTVTNYEQLVLALMHGVV